MCASVKESLLSILNKNSIEKLLYAWSSAIVAPDHEHAPSTDPAVGRRDAEPEGGADAAHRVRRDAGVHAGAPLPGGDALGEALERTPRRAEIFL